MIESTHEKQNHSSRKFSGANLRNFWVEKQKNFKNNLANRDLPHENVSEALIPIVGTQRLAKQRNYEDLEVKLLYKLRT